MTGESLWNALHPEDRVSVREAFEEGFARKEPFERQIRLRRASDGTYRWHLARVVPERGSDGEGAEAGAITGWIAAATDIDDQKKAEQVLREAIGLREDFLSVASHELRTPAHLACGWRWRTCCGSPAATPARRPGTSSSAPNGSTPRRRGSITSSTSCSTCRASRPAGWS